MSVVKYIEDISRLLLLWKTLLLLFSDKDLQLLSYATFVGCTDDKGLLGIIWEAECFLNELIRLKALLQ